MINERFYKNSGPYKLSEIIELIRDHIIPVADNYKDILVNNIRSLEEASTNDISCLNNSKYLEQFHVSKSGVCIVPADFAEKTVNTAILLKAKNPYFVYAKLIDLFYSKAKTYPSKIMPSAYIANSARVGNNCYIGHNVVIEENAVIGDDCIIEAGSFIDAGVVIGSRALIYSNVSISYSIIGDDAVILPGARIGQDGFGFATEQGVHHKILHTGVVRIGNNVEIGANSTIDRGSINDTIIEDMCRIDNLVQIGHNVIIDKGAIMVAQVGIAGSSKVGKYCALGGQVGVAGHVVIGDKAQVAAQGGVAQDIAPGMIVGGSPTVPIRDWHKQSIIMKQLISKRN